MARGGDGGGDGGGCCVACIIYMHGYIQLPMCYVHINNKSNSVSQNAIIQSIYI